MKSYQLRWRHEIPVLTVVAGGLFVVGAVTVKITKIAIVIKPTRDVLRDFVFTG